MLDSDEDPRYNTRGGVGGMSSWDDSVHYCQWIGVYCSSHRHVDRVTALILLSHGLVPLTAF